MLLRTLTPFCILWCYTFGKNVYVDVTVIENTISAVENALRFFSEDYSSINVDGLFGLRLGQGKFTVKPVLRGHSKRTPKIGFQYRLPLNAGQKYCRMLQAILSTFNKLPFYI